jgi:hypothetical protein
VIIASLIELIGFVFWELRVDHPVLDIKLFLKNKIFAFS